MSNEEKHIEGVCPNCGSNNIYMDDWENFSGDLGRRWDCGSCDSYGIAYYDYKFGEYVIRGKKNDDDYDDDDSWGDDD